MKRLLTFICALLMTASFAAAQEKTVYLDEMDLSKTTCGWKQTAANKTVDGAEPSICGRKFEHCVGHHAPGDILIALPNQCGIKFSGVMGIDDETQGQGHAEYEVYCDWKLVWKSGELVGNKPAKDFSIDLTGVSVLLIKACTLPEGYAFDHLDLGDAKITYKGDVAPHTQGLSNYRIVDGVCVNRMDEVGSEWLALSHLIKTGMRQNAKDEALDPAATLFDTDRDPLDIVVRRIVPLVEKLSSMPNAPDLSKQKKTLEQLQKEVESTPVDNVDARKALFVKATQLRREIALKNPLINFTDILFIKRHFNPEPEVEGNHMCDQFFGFHGRQGGGLFVLKNAFSDKPEAIDLLADVPVAEGQYKGTTLDKTWAFLAPELSYDNNEILFCATDAKQPRHTYTWTDENTYHIFKAKYDPKTRKLSDVVQLTQGAFNDIDPCYLPNGRIIFISERRQGYGRCHGRPVPCYTLHSMNPDGSDIVILSPHETNEWEPDIDHNGMVIYTRWDYVDRGFSQAHHPWITTPDGRDPRVLQGNYDRVESNRPHFECDVHPIPGSQKIIATATGHHAQHYGSLILIDPNKPDANMPGQVKRITPDQPYIESEMPTHSESPQAYGTARPLSEEFYICVYDPFTRSDGGESNNYGIYLLDCYGNKVLLYRDPDISCRDAIPIRPRKRQNIVTHATLLGKPLAPGEKYVPIDPKDIPKTGKVGLINVYDTMFPFYAQPDGSKTVIKKLRIVQVLPKTTPYADNPRIGYGSQKGARKILGTVPVEPDGSAYFNLPVDVPVYFQALDENGVAVQGMRSATYVHPGEQLICQGCHENRHSGRANRPAGIPSAMRRAPSDITPDVEGTNPLNFVTLVQPVLDAKCVKCHAGANTDRNQPGIDADKMNKAASIDLSDDKQGHFSRSFENLRRFCFFFDSAGWTEPQTMPGQFGSNRSPLYRNVLRNPETKKTDHYGVQLTPEEIYKFTVWMDNNCDFYGSYDQCELQRQGEKVEIKLE